MVPLIKLAAVSKSSEEASSLQKSACLSSPSLHFSRKIAISCVYWLLSTFCKKHFIAHVGLILMVDTKITWNKIGHSYEVLLDCSIG